MGQLIYYNYDDALFKITDTVKEYLENNKKDIKLSNLTSSLYEAKDETGNTIFIPTKSGDKAYVVSYLPDGDCIYYAFEYQTDQWIFIAQKLHEEKIEDNKEESY
jgi:hypothetical protein